LEVPLVVEVETLRVNEARERDLQRAAADAVGEQGVGKTVVVVEAIVDVS
jgi:hypothetical protein